MITVQGRINGWKRAAPRSRSSNACTSFRNQVKVRLMCRFPSLKRVNHLRFVSNEEGEVGSRETTRTTGRCLAVLVALIFFFHAEVAIGASPDAGDPAARQLTGHTGEVFALAFSPGGGQLASGGGDQTIRLWEPATGRELKALGDTRALSAHSRSLLTVPCWRRAAPTPPSGSGICRRARSSSH